MYKTFTTSTTYLYDDDGKLTSKSVTRSFYNGFEDDDQEEEQMTGDYENDDASSEFEPETAFEITKVIEIGPKEILGFLLGTLSVAFAAKAVASKLRKA